MMTHDLRGLITQRELADELKQARDAIRRIDDILALMRDLYAAQGDTRAVVLVDTIRSAVVARELPREPVPADVEGRAIGTRHPDGAA